MCFEWTFPVSSYEFYVIGVISTILHIHMQVPFPGKFSSILVFHIEMVISQETLTKSNEVFATFKKEMEKVLPMLNVHRCEAVNNCLCWIQ